MFGNCSPNVSADASTQRGVVRGQQRRWPRFSITGSRRGGCGAGEQPITEVTDNPEDFVVSPARLKRRLEDEVGNVVIGVVCSRVVKATASSLSSNQEIVA